MVARLQETVAVDRFVSILGYHLGEQHHYRIDVDAALAASEKDRFQCVPLIFGLIPKPAVFRADATSAVKPMIREHLKSFGLDENELLVDVLKDLSDNIYRTGYSAGPARTRPRKASIADLRQQPELYRSIRAKQGARCACCGCLFGLGDKEETLDHVIPWRLGGDPPGGWNWQLLCKRCNGAKDTLVSALTLPEYQNWIYSDFVRTLQPNADVISERGRYLVLKYYGRCQVPNCNAMPATQELAVTKNSSAAFPVFDHTSVACVEHCLHLGLERVG